MFEPYKRFSNKNLQGFENLEGLDSTLNDIFSSEKVL